MITTTRTLPAMARARATPDGRRQRQALAPNGPLRTTTSAQPRPCTLTTPRTSTQKSEVVTCRDFATFSHVAAPRPYDPGRISGGKPFQTPCRAGPATFQHAPFFVTRQCELNCSSSHDFSNDLERSCGSCWPFCLIAQACALEHIAIGRSPQPLDCSNRLFPLCCRPPPPSAMVHSSSTATAAAALQHDGAFGIHDLAQRPPAQAVCGRALPGLMRDRPDHVPHLDKKDGGGCGCGWPWRWRSHGVGAAGLLVLALDWVQILLNAGLELRTPLKVEEEAGAEAGCLAANNSSAVKPT